MFNLIVMREYSHFNAYIAEEEFDDINPLLSYIEDNLENYQYIPIFNAYCHFPSLGDYRIIFCLNDIDNEYENWGYMVVGEQNKIKPNGDIFEISKETDIRINNIFNRLKEHAKLINLIGMV